MAHEHGRKRRAVLWSTAPLCKSVNFRADIALHRGDAFSRFAAITFNPCMATEKTATLVTANKPIQAIYWSSLLARLKTSTSSSFFLATGPVLAWSETHQDKASTGSLVKSVSMGIGRPFHLPRFKYPNGGSSLERGRIGWKEFVLTEEGPTMGGCRFL